MPFWPRSMPIVAKVTSSSEHRAYVRSDNRATSKLAGVSLSPLRVHRGLGKLAKLVLVPHVFACVCVCARACSSFHLS